MSNSSANSGLSRRSHQSPPPLICLPFAGAGPSFFKDWVPLTSSLDIVAPQLPGREKRFLEEPYRDVSQAITGILEEVLQMIGKRNRVNIFGHSLGAVLAYELAHRLAGIQGVQVEHLVVSGSPGPWTPRQRRATGMDDEGFIGQVREFAGYDHPALNDPDMREMLLPLLRADVEMHENYYPPEGQMLEVPIMSVRGTDDELVSRDEAVQWQTATTMPLQLIEIPGGHMYLTKSPDKLLRRIESLVSTPAVAPEWSPV
ncbi:MAG: alpha/beta fold hydrolase [Acidobacteriia bacterium]|nr:alpha/beta fold hydrolase [Terriglobia bacterium]